MSASSLPGLLVELAASRPSDTALRHYQMGIWTPTTFREYARRAAHVAAGLAQLGVEAGDTIAIHSENRPEWVVADMAAQGMHTVVVGVYPTSPATEVEYLLSHSGAVVVIVEDEEQLDKTLAVRSRLERLRHIVIIDTRGIDVDAVDGAVTFDQLVAIGASADADGSRWAAQVAAIDPATCAIIVYTSGTTGPPKGAMISHANLMAAADAVAGSYSARPDDEVLSYLPLCHIAERLFSTIAALRVGYVVNFGEGGDALADDLRRVQPTVLLGVPRVWERLLAGVQIRMQDASRLKRRLYGWALALGHRRAQRRLAGTDGVLDQLYGGLAWLLAFRSLRHKLGLGRIRVAISGAAPIAPGVLDFFWSMGVEIREAYGQTENTAVCTSTPEGAARLGAVGQALPGVEIRIADDGEILTRSAGVFMGYLHQPEATAETVDADGWLHTGDVGHLDEAGYLHITDRKKDIIITAGGKNISPSEIENRLKMSPYVAEAMVIGDGRKYLTALIGIEYDTVGDWATRRGLPYTTYADLAGKDEVRELVGEWVSQVNAELAQVETVKYFTMLRKQLDEEEGELTPTQKVKRRALEAEFATDIEAMYR